MNRFAKQYLNLQNCIADIFDWECYWTPKQVEEKEKHKGDVPIFHYLRNPNVEAKMDRAYEMSTQVFCQNLAGNSVTAYRELYHEWAILDVYLYHARMMAMEAIKKE